MKRLGVLAIVAAAALLTGCSGSTTYASPESLLDAYEEAGGNCAAPMEVGEGMLSEGAHGILCGDPITFLIVFDSNEAKDRYLARTGDSGYFSYGGERWLASSEEDGVVADLGGSSLDR